MTTPTTKPFTPAWPSYERARAMLRNSCYTLTRHTREWSSWTGDRGEVMLFEDGQVWHRGQMLTLSAREFGEWLNP